MSHVSGSYHNMMCPIVTSPWLHVPICQSKLRMLRKSLAFLAMELISLYLEYDMWRPLTIVCPN